MQTYQRLSSEERELLSIGFKEGQSQSQLARRLDRHRSTISRELRRNAHEDHGYTAYSAHEKAIHKAVARRKGRRKLVQNNGLWKLVQELLKLYWSPEQISGYLNSHYHDRRDMQISPEAIYHHIYVLPRGELKKSLIRCLRQRKSQRGRRRAKGKENSAIPNMVSIHDRPKEVDERRIPGHWEGDLIMGADNKSAMGTLVERVTRFTILVRLDHKDSDFTCMRFALKLIDLPKMLRKSMTYDQGRELSSHDSFTGLSQAQVYFCDPHSPWQRGTNENTNGLLRQYFPKGTDFQTVPVWVFDHVQNQFNERPRKVLGYRTPKETFMELVALEN